MLRPNPGPTEAPARRYQAFRNILVTEHHCLLQTGGLLYGLNRFRAVLGPSSVATTALELTPVANRPTAAVWASKGGMACLGAGEWTFQLSQSVIAFLPSRLPLCMSELTTACTTQKGASTSGISCLNVKLLCAHWQSHQRRMVTDAVT